MTAALELAELGFEADLVERGEELGGNLRTAYHTLDGGNTQELLRPLVERVGANEMVKVYLNTEVRELGGSKGKFLTTLALADGSPVPSKVEGDEVLEHGAIIVATGAQPATTTKASRIAATCLTLSPPSPRRVSSRRPPRGADPYPRSSARGAIGST